MVPRIHHKCHSFTLNMKIITLPHFYIIVVFISKQKSRDTTSVCWNQVTFIFKDIQGGTKKVRSRGKVFDKFSNIFYGVFLSIYSHLFKKSEHSKLCLVENCNRGHKIINSAAKVLIFKTLITSKLIDIKRIFLNIFLGVSLKKGRKILKCKKFN